MPRTAQNYSLPAPVGGLNGKDALANMPETDAVILDNWFPLPSSIAVRNGYSNYATFTGNCYSIMPYTVATSPKLFVAVQNGSTYSIYDATTGGALSSAVVGGGGATVQALTSAKFNYTNFANTSGQYLYLVNGSDNPVYYNGSTWTVAGITGVTQANLINVQAFKNRLWFIEKNTFNVWYLAISAITGAATQLNLGSYFQLGGSLQCMATWSVDNAGGLNDFAAFVSTEGEVLIFQGYDPASASTWSQAGHFRVGAPVGFGNRCWARNGSDAIVIGRDGVFPLSAGLLTDRSQQQDAISDKIRNLVNNDVASFASNFGWDVKVYPLGNKIIVNVPSSSTVSYQYVMNQITGAWCTFGKYNSPWNAYCFEIQSDKLYWGGSGVLALADSGGNDNGSPIVSDALQAFSYFGERGVLKQWTMARPMLTTYGSVSYGLDMNLDFVTSVPTSTFVTSVGGGIQWSLTGTPGTATQWGTSGVAGTAPQWGASQQTQKTWSSVRGLGFAGALRMRISSNQTYGQWSATDFLFNTAQNAF